MKINWKTIAIILVLTLLLGMGCLMVTSKTQNLWRQGIPVDIRGRWTSKEYKRTADGANNFIISRNRLGNLKGSIYYQHKSGSKYYYIKTIVQFKSDDERVLYTWYKVEHDNLTFKTYGEKVNDKYRATPQSPIEIWHRE